MTDERLAEIRAILDGNDWWVLGCGDHMNIADELLAAYDELLADRERRPEAARVKALEAVAVAAQQLTTARGSGVWMAAWQDLIDALASLPDSQ